GLGMADTLLREQGQRSVVVHVGSPAVVGKDAAMPVVGILAETLIGDEQDLVFESRTQRPQGLLDDALVGEGAGTGGVLVRRNAEQNEGTQADAEGGANFFR